MIILLNKVTIKNCKFIVPYKELINKNNIKNQKAYVL